MRVLRVRTQASTRGERRCTSDAHERQREPSRHHELVGSAAVVGDATELEANRDGAWLRVDQPCGREGATVNHVVAVVARNALYVTRGDPLPLRCAIHTQSVCAHVCVREETLARSLSEM